MTKPDLSTASESDLRRALAGKRKERRAPAKAKRLVSPKADEPKIVSEPGDATPRKAMGANRRGRIIARQGHVCARCAEKVSTFEIDHVLPLELGGAEDDDNLEALCGRCHRAKTNADIQRIAKARRQAKMMGARAPSRHPIRSRGFG